MNIRIRMEALARAAREAAGVLALASAEQKTQALMRAAEGLRMAESSILDANAQDMAAATHLDGAMRDRLLLTPARIAAMANGLAQVASLSDPVGRVLAKWDNPTNGLHFEKVAVPIGVIGMIYESRPNVTADAAALSIKSGNAVILRGGSESFRSTKAIIAPIQQGLAAAGLPEACAQLVPMTDREGVAWMLGATDYLDVIIPRGGKSLTDRVRRAARVPTLLHLDGNCHLYVHWDIEPAIAERIVLNAKLRRTGVCGALESLLIDRAVPESGKDIILELLKRGCEVRGDAAIQAIDPRVKPASSTDWSTEYLAPILSVKTVAGPEEAIAHINRYGSHHTDGILTRDKEVADAFCRQVDSAIVLVNASTQFADGGEFGFGGEIGIATGRLHARGPVAAPELTTYKYVVTTKQAEGAIRAE